MESKIFSLFNWGYGARAKLQGRGGGITLFCLFGDLLYTFTWGVIFLGARGRCPTATNFNGFLAGMCVGIFFPQALGGFFLLISFISKPSRASGINGWAGGGLCIKNLLGAPNGAARI